MSGGWRFFLLSLPAPLSLGIFAYFGWLACSAAAGTAPSIALAPAAWLREVLPVTASLIYLAGVFFCAFLCGTFFSGRSDFAGSRLLRSALGSTFYLLGLLVAWLRYGLPAGMALALGLVGVLGMHRALQRLLAGGNRHS